MKARLPMTALVLLTLSTSPAFDSLGAQPSAAKPSGALKVCSLLTDVEIQQLVARGGSASEKNETPHKDTVTKHPVSGAGEGAYVIYPKPRDEYEVRVGLLATKYRQYMLGISIEPDKGKPSESVQPDLVALTKVVMQKLP